MSAPGLALPVRAATGARAAGLAVACLDTAALARRAAAWDRLVAESADANPFHARAVAEAHRAGRVGAAPSWLVVESGGELLALLPHLPRGRRVGLWRRSCAAGWATPYTCDGTPLLAAHRAAEAAAALLDGMAEVNAGCWLLPGVALHGPTAHAIRVELVRRRWPHAILSAWPRPVLEARADEAACEALWSRNRRKGLRRQAARLAALGPVEHRSAEAGPELAAAVEAFLALEAAGWKGRRGTALLSRPGTAALARRLFAGAEGPVAPRADLLLLDGRPVAASLALVCRGTAYLLKGAYDEALRACAPGILLEAAIVRALHRDGFARRLNSCAAPGTPLDGLYPDRVWMGDLLLGAGQVHPERFAAIAAAESRARTHLAGAKEGVGAVRSWADRLRSRFRPAAHAAPSEPDGAGPA